MSSFELTANRMFHHDLLHANWLDTATTRCLCAHIFIYVCVYAYLWPDDAIACYMTTYSLDDGASSVYYIILSCSVT